MHLAFKEQGGLFFGTIPFFAVKSWCVVGSTAFTVDK